jgi:hypothetical protein
MTSDNQNIDKTEENNSECNMEEILIGLTMKLGLTLNTKKLKGPKHYYIPHLQLQHPRHLSAFRTNINKYKCY